MNDGAQNIRLFKKSKQTNFRMTLCYSGNVLSKTLVILLHRQERSKIYTMLGLYF